MHYRHAYHAGNFADVFKHVLLVGLLQSLSRKDKPWCYLDTHAGAGRYDLGGEAAGRTAEWRDGIARLMDVQNAPQPLAAYLAFVRGQWGAVSAVSHGFYPGSPLIAQALLRPGDRLILCEKMPDVMLELKSCISGELHQRDGYEAHGLLPPREKRGLILIDPPFEARDEFERIGVLLEKSITRFSSGVYAVWYPLKNRFEAARFVRRAQRECKRPLLNIEFDNGAPGEGQMRSCGLLILNPPYQFEREMEPALKLLVNHLSQGPKAAWRSELL